MVTKRLHTAEVEIVGAGDVIDGPGFPAIFSYEICAMGSAGPDLAAIDDADPAQGFGGGALLRSPLGEAIGGEQEDQREAHGAKDTRS